MKPNKPISKAFPSLADIEREVVAESREWGRRRLEERLQKLAAEHGEVFPLRQRRSRSLTLRSEFGEVKLVVDYGQDPHTGQWGCPLRVAWQLGPHQKLTPGFAEKLCFTATATGSYEEAAQVASRWAQTIDDATLHALVQRMGVRAEAQAQSRYEQPPVERLPQRGPCELGVLMVDGCQVRYRGAGWGKKKTRQERVQWHELKLGVFYRHEESAHTQGGRGLLTDKLVVSWQDQALELGRRLNWEALREGLGRARQTLFLGDGAEWVWNLKQDRWKAALEVLDFYHGSEHLWNLGRALYGEQGAGARTVGGTPAPPSAAWSGTTSATPDCATQKTPRCSGQGDSARAKLLCHACRPDELPDHRKTRVAHRFGCRRISVPPEAMPV